LVFLEKFKNKDKDYELMLFHTKTPISTEFLDEPSGGIFLKFSTPLHDPSLYLLSSDLRHNESLLQSIKEICNFTQIFNIFSSSHSESKELLRDELLLFSQETVDNGVNIHTKEIPSKKLYSDFVASFSEVTSVEKKGNTPMKNKLFVVTKYDTAFIDRLLEIKTKLLTTEKVSSHEGFVRTITKLRGQVFEFNLPSNIPLESLWSTAIQTVDTLDDPPIRMGFEYNRNMKIDSPAEYELWGRKELSRTEGVSAEEFNKWVTKNVHKIFAPGFKKEILVAGFKLLQKEPNSLPSEINNEIPKENPNMEVFKVDEGINPFGVPQR